MADLSHICKQLYRIWSLCWNDDCFVQVL